MTEKQKLSILKDCTGQVPRGVIDVLVSIITDQQAMRGIMMDKSARIEGNIESLRSALLIMNRLVDSVCDQVYPGVPVLKPTEMEKRITLLEKEFVKLRNEVVRVKAGGGTLENETISPGNSKK